MPAESYKAANMFSCEKMGTSIRLCYTIAHMLTNCSRQALHAGVMLPQGAPAPALHWDENDVPYIQSKHGDLLISTIQHLAPGSSRTHQSNVSDSCTS